MLRLAYLSLYNAVCFCGWAYILLQVRCTTKSRCSGHYLFPLTNRAY
jgi:hypothetical protein